MRSFQLTSDALRTEAAVGAVVSEAVASGGVSTASRTSSPTLPSSLRPAWAAAARRSRASPRRFRSAGAPSRGPDPRRPVLPRLLSTGFASLTWTGCGCFSGSASRFGSGFASVGRRRGRGLHLFDQVGRDIARRSVDHGKCREIHDHGRRRSRSSRRVRARRTARARPHCAPS